MAMALMRTWTCVGEGAWMGDGEAVRGADWEGQLYFVHVAILS